MEKFGERTLNLKRLASKEFEVNAKVGSSRNLVHVHSPVKRMVA